MNPFFTIVIPAYNRAKELPETIKSVQNQTFTNWELIVVDDGSTDNTKTVVEGMNDIRVKYFWQKNAERSAARNTGARLAQGTYICFLDSDDKFLPNHLETLRNCEQIEKKLKVLAFTNCRVIKNGVDTNFEIPHLTGNPLVFFIENPVIPARVCIHRDIFEKHQFHEKITIVEDTLLWIKIAADFKVVHINKDTVHYMIHENNSVNLKNNPARTRLNGLKLFEKENKVFLKKVPKRVWKATKANTVFKIAQYYILKDKYLKASYYTIFSIFTDFKSAQIKHRSAVVLALLWIKSSSYSGKILSQYK